MPNKTHKVIFSLVLALCVGNSLVATFTAFSGDETVSPGKMLSSWVPTFFFIGFGFLLVKKRGGGAKKRAGNKGN